MVCPPDVMTSPWAATRLVIGNIPRANHAHKTHFEGPEGSLLAKAVSIML